MIRQLDWEKAAKICDVHKGCNISAGLMEDWYYTADEIFDGENHVKGYPYVSSYWATPIVMVEKDDGTILLPCWKEGNDSDMPDWWTEGAEE